MSDVVPIERLLTDEDLAVIAMDSEGDYEDLGE